MIKEGRLADAFVEEAEIAVTEVIDQNVNDIGACGFHFNSMLDSEGIWAQQVESDGSLEKVATMQSSQPARVLGDLAHRLGSAKAQCAESHLYNRLGCCSVLKAAQVGVGAIESPQSASV